MLTVWREPVGGRAYCIGVDTAEGLAHGDYSCAQVIDVRAGEQVAVWHGHIPPDTLANEVHLLALWYNNALTCVESNNHGLTTIVQLRNLGHRNLFRKRTLNTSIAKVSMEFGWKTTRTTKPLLIDDLGMAIRNDEIIVHDRYTLAELRTYVRSSRGSMNGSPHDDRVMALALANQMRQYAFMPEYAPAVDDYWTVDWFARMVKPDENPDLRIGANTVRGTV
jgi:hypothetical protein|tara:strand:+ start:282 stop:947 length:666 start_codon:yes stop_codon:yes gene_type:complete